MSYSKSVYVHIPFCKSRCLYCDFVSSVASGLAGAYVDALVKEIDLRRAAGQFDANSLENGTVYIGGGTPSLLSASELRRVLAAIGVDQAKTAEVTIEVNPSDAGIAWYREMLQAGVNRVSIGAQAMSDRRLKWLGRRHGVDDVRAAVQEARAAGCENISVDFIYGAPGDTLDGLLAELDSLLELNVEHVSLYELTVAPDAPLARMDCDMPGETFMADAWEALGRRASLNGFERYEISNFAKSAYRSRHNQVYWNGGCYVGIGAGAHGFIQRQSEMVRYSNSASIVDYIQTNGEPIDGFVGECGQSETISALDQARERIMLGLRCVDGFELAALHDLVDEDVFSSFFGRFTQLEDEGHILFSADGKRICPTPAGMLLADSLALSFF